MPSLSTLSAIAVFTPALAGCLLLLSWLQHQRVMALALWASGFIIASVATTLIIVLRGEVPNIVLFVVVSDGELIFRHLEMPPGLGEPA